MAQRSASKIITQASRSHATRSVAFSVIVFVLLLCHLHTSSNALSVAFLKARGATYLNSNTETRHLHVNEGDHKVHTSDDAAQNKKLPIALLASPTRVEPLVNWLVRNEKYMLGETLLLPSELKNLLSLDPRLWSLNFEELPETFKGADIILAGNVLAGKVSKVIFFQDSALATVPDANMIMRACEIGKVPLAMNEATADLAVRGMVKNRLAYVIFNPVAGQRDPDEDLKAIFATLEPQIGVTVIRTLPDVDPASQATEIIEMIKARPDSATDASTMIIASGGDGTVSAIAGATMGSGIPFGVVPRGTANAFAVALGIPTDVDGACRNILEGNVRVVDGARCNDIPMLLLAGVGFEAGMVENAPRELKNVLGPVAYLLGGVKQIFDQEPFKCKIEVDGEKSEFTAGAITVANMAPPTSVLAQGFGNVCPDDGTLDITIGLATDRIEGIADLTELAAHAIVKTPTENERLLCLRAKEFTVSCEPQQTLVVDGELVKIDPVTFTALPGALNVIAPPKKETTS